MTDLSAADYQERERLKIKLAQAELTAQLNGTAKAPGFGPPWCPTEARERHQKRLSRIEALCASVTVLAQHL